MSLMLLKHFLMNKNITLSAIWVIWQNGLQYRLDSYRIILLSFHFLTKNRHFGGNFKNCIFNENLDFSPFNNHISIKWPKTLYSGPEIAIR